MKKYPLLILTVLLLLFSGCQPEKAEKKKADVSSFFNNINTSFCAQFGEFETEGFFSFTPERLTLEFAQPKTLNGFKIQVDSQSITFSLGELSVTKQNSKITEQFNALAVFSVLNNARLTGILNKTDGITTITGEGYEITFDSENRVNEISIPEKRINIKLEW